MSGPSLSIFARRFTTGCTRESKGGVRSVTGIAWSGCCTALTSRKTTWRSSGKKVWPCFANLKDGFRTRLATDVREIELMRETSKRSPVSEYQKAREPICFAIETASCCKSGDAILKELRAELVAASRQPGSCNSPVGMTTICVAIGN